MKSVLSYILGAMSFISLLLVPGVIESEKYILTFFLIIAIRVEAYLSIKINEESTHDR